MKPYMYIQKQTMQKNVCNEIYQLSLLFEMLISILILILPFVLALQEFNFTFIPVCESSSILRTSELCLYPMIQYNV
jgi:Ni,Fe-hydrogenase I cytochrome b subunit